VATTSYLVNLLCGFVRSDELFDHSADGVMLQPLATLYSRALNSSGIEEQRQHLQKLGDIALFIAGVFSYSLNRKIVDVDYYIAMGGNAYGYLSSAIHGNTRGAAMVEVFGELSRRFHQFVEVLSEVSEHSHLTNDTDLLREYELWVRTGSKRAADRLQRAGIYPALGSTSRSHH
jgi:hypothetical protein